MRRFMRGCLILSLASIWGCGICPRSGKEAPGKTCLALLYWDESGGGDVTQTYDTKMIVFIDGEKAGESAVAPRHERKKLTIEVEPGSHVILIEGYGMKDGAWEKRTRERGYPADHRFEKEVDIQNGETRVINYVVPDTSKYLKFRL